MKHLTLPLCCLAACLAPPSRADEWGTLKSPGGRVISITRPKGGLPGGMVLQKVQDVRKRGEAEVRRVVTEYKVVFAPHLRDGDLSALSLRLRSQFPHLPGQIKEGDRVEVLILPKPGKDGRYTAVGLREMKKYAELERKERAERQKATAKLSLKEWMARQQAQQAEAKAKD